MIVECLRCTETRPLYARGLCTACHSKSRRDNTLADYPRRDNTADDFLDDYRLLAESGCRRDQVAARLGVKRASLERRVQRLRARGVDVEMVPA